MGIELQYLHSTSATIVVLVLLYWHNTSADEGNVLVLQCLHNISAGVTAVVVVL
jgi:hypothetical protein